MPKYQTKQRKALLTFFESHPDEIFSAKQIAEHMQADELSMSAVYRNLTELESEGTIQRAAKGGSKQAFYRFVGAESCKNHLHLACSRCGKTFHMDLPESAVLMDRVKDSSDFRIDSAKTVLYGVCGNCKEQN